MMVPCSFCSSIKRIKGLLDPFVHQLPSEDLPGDFAKVCRDPPLEVTQNAIGGEKFVHTVWIFGQRAAAIKTQMVVRISNDREDLHLHAEKFHFTDQAFDTCFVDTFNLSELRSDSALNDADLPIGTSHGAGEK